MCPDQSGAEWETVSTGFAKECLGFFCGNWRGKDRLLWNFWAVHAWRCSQLLLSISFRDALLQIIYRLHSKGFFFLFLKGNSLKNSSIQYKLRADFLSMIQVAWFLIQEREKAGRYLQQASLEKLLEVFLFVLLMFYHH